MKKSGKVRKFKVDERVAQCEEEWNPDEDTTLYGRVVGYNETNGRVFVKWDGSYYKDKLPYEVSEEDLLTEKEAERENARLEKEYNKFAKPIEKKLEQAAKLLREANEIADEHGKDLSQMHDLVGPLVSAMDDAGWRTSALWC